MCTFPMDFVKILSSTYAPFLLKALDASWSPGPTSSSLFPLTPILRSILTHAHIRISSQNLPFQFLFFQKKGVMYKWDADNL